MGMGSRNQNLLFGNVMLIVNKTFHDLGFDGMLCDKLVHEPGGGHDHPGTGTLGVEFRSPGGGIGISGRILQNLPADDAAVDDSLASGYIRGLNDQYSFYVSSDDIDSYTDITRAG